MFLKWRLGGKDVITLESPVFLLEKYFDDLRDAAKAVDIKMIERGKSKYTGT